MEEVLLNPVVISGLIAAMVSVLGYLAANRKVVAEANNVEAQTQAETVKSALTLIEPMRGRITSLEARLDKLEKTNKSQAKRIAHLEDGVMALQAQVLELGAAPVFEIGSDDF